MAQPAAIDGSVNIDTRIDRSGVKKGMDDVTDDIKTGFDKAGNAVDDNLSKILINVGKLSPAFRSVFAKLSAVLAGIAPEVVAILAALAMLGIGATKVFKGIKNAIKFAIDGIKKLVQTLKDYIAQILGKIIGSITNVYKYLSRIILRSLIYGAIRAFKQVLQAGLELSELNQAMEELRTTIKYLAADLISLFAPQLSSIIAKLVDFLNVIRQVIAALRGQSTYTKLVMKDTKEAGGAARQAAGDLAAFDKIDVLRQDRGGGGGAGDSELVEELVEEIDAKWKEIADKIAAAVEKIKAKIMELWNVLEPFRNFIVSVGESFLHSFLIPVAEWTLGEGWDRFIEITERLMQNVDWDKLAGSIDRFFQAVSRLTIEVFTGLLTFYDRFLEPIAEWTLNEAIPRFLDAISAAVGNIDWENLQQHWGNLLDVITEFALLNLDNLLTFVTDVLIPIGEWIIDEAVPRFFDSLANVLNILTIILQILQPHWDKFFETVLTPIAEWSGETFLTFWDWLNEKLVELAEWMEENPEKVENFFEFIAVSAVSSLIALAIVLAPVVLLFGLLALAIFLCILPFALVTAAVFGIITAIIMLAYYIGKLILDIAKNADKIKQKWEEIKQWTEDMKNSIIEKWETLKQEAAELWEDLKIKAKKAWEELKISAAETWEDIKNKITMAIDMAVASAIRRWNNLVTAFENSKQGIKNALNSIIEGIETFVNGAITGINSLISALNSFQVTIPPIEVAGRIIWGGTTIGGFDLAHLGYVQLPRLAQGAIIPPNSEFLAILGDQKHGRNIEAPEDTIRDIFREELSDMLTDQQVTINFAGSLGALVRELKPHIDKEEIRIGKSMVRGVVR